MRVAIFAEYYHPFISGVVTHIDTLRQGLEAEGHEVLIVTLDPAARRHYIKDNVLHCPAIPLKKVYGYGVSSPVNRLRLKLIKKFDPDIIHLHTEFTMGLFALHCAKQLRKPAVYTLHTLYDDYLFYVFPKNTKKMATPFAHAYIRKVASQATEIIGPSVKVAEYMRKCGVRRHINIVPNTIDVSEFMPENVDPKDTAAVKAELGIREGDTCLCFVGRLGKEKSLDVLIDYFAKSFGGEDAYKLFIIGDGPDKAELKAQIDTLGVQGQVKLLGRIEHNILTRYYSTCDLFATASLSEMNSISLIEANASGLYAVHRLDIYNRDQIHSGINGDVFTSEKEFADIVRGHAALSPEQRKTRRNAVTAYAQRYGVKEFTQAITNVYDRAIDHY